MGRHKATEEKIAAAKKLLKRHGEMEAAPSAPQSRNFIRGNAEKVIGEKRISDKSEDELKELRKAYQEKLPEMLEEWNTNVLVKFLNEHSDVLEAGCQPLMDRVVKRAARSFTFFAENFLHVTDADTEEQVPFKLNEGQRKGHVAYLRQLRKTGRGWLDVSKTRQIGFTTYTNGRALHHGLFYKQAYIIIMASKQENSNKNLERIKTMFINMPSWFLNNYVYQYAGNTGDHKSNASQLEFDSHWTETKAQFISASANGDSVRGHQPNFVHWTETAFCQEAASAATAIMPALRKRKGSTFIIESTSNGLGNWYADLTLSLEEGEQNDFALVFIPWFDDDSNKMSPPKDFKRTKEENDIAEELGLTDSQLYWRRTTIASDGGDVSKFNQEYPYSVKSSFLTSDDIFFSEECMTKVFQQASEAEPQRLEVTAEGIKLSEFGTLLIYRETEKEMQYVIGVDASAGTVNGDYTVVTVVDAFGNLVAQYRDKPTVDESSAIINRLGRHYNNATLIIERDHHGHYIMGALATHFKYPYIFRDTDNRLGWKPQGSKFEICANLQDDILNGRIVVPSAHLYDEMQTFVVIKKKTIGAKDECHDDVIISTAVAYHGWRIVKPKAISRETKQRVWSNRPRKRFSIAR